MRKRGQKRKRGPKITSQKTLRKRSKPMPASQMINMGKADNPGDVVMSYIGKRATLGVWKKENEFIVGLKYKPYTTKNKEGAVNMHTKPFEELLRTEDKTEAKEMFEKIKIIKFRN